MNLSPFEEFDLSPELLKALEKKGYTRPTAIQLEAIPAAMEERDVLGSAPTGTGKTAAFLLPAIQHLLDYPRRKPGAPRILILTPTRELAMQVAEQAEELAQFTHLKIATIADRMLQMGFGQDAEKIAAETRWRKQTLLFSATLEGELLVDFAERLLNNPVKIDAEPSRRERKKINQWYYHADSNEHKIKLLARFIETENVSRGIVFVRRREDVRELSETLRKPYSADTYLHRIGRTARAGKKGTAVSFVEAHDYKLLGKIKRYTAELLKARILEGLEPRTKPPKDGEVKSISKKQKARIKEKREEKKKSEVKKKAKLRHKDTKNIGKRRKPSAEKTAEK